MAQPSNGMKGNLLLVMVISIARRRRGGCTFWMKSVALFAKNSQAQTIEGEIDDRSGVQGEQLAHD